MKLNDIELNKQWNMPYHEQTTYLKTKYGAVPKNYFTNPSCKYKTKGITRTDEGLFIHHDYEYDPDDDKVNDLSKPENASYWPWKYQLAANLTYCNWIEHLMLHIKINLLRKQQLGFYINDGVENYFIPDLNKLYSYKFDLDAIPAWMLQCFIKVEDCYDDYCLMLDEWIKLIGYPEFNWRTK